MQCGHSTATGLLHYADICLHVNTALFEGFFEVSLMLQQNFLDLTETCSKGISSNSLWLTDEINGEITHSVNIRYYSLKIGALRSFIW
jgi:hypothetical protein